MMDVGRREEESRSKGGTASLRQAVEEGEESCG